MKVKIHYILEFYLTIGVPLLYLFVLYAASIGDTIEVPTIFRLFGLAATIIGIIFWIVSYLQLGKSFGVLPGSKKRVVTGLYSRYKHPMYIGITLTFFGISLANNSSLGLLSTTLILIPVLYLRAKLEERKLS